MNVPSLLSSEVLWGFCVALPYFCRAKKRKRPDVGCMSTDDAACWPNITELSQLLRGSGRGVREKKRQETEESETDSSYFPPDFETK